VGQRSKRWALVALLAACALSGCSSGKRAPEPSFRPDPQPRNVFDICAIYREKPQWAKAAATAERRWGAPQDVKMAIIWRESTFRQAVRPMKTENGRRIPASSALGFSQAIDGTWAWYQQDTRNPRASRTEFADAIDFVGWYLDKSRELNGLAPTDAFNQYLAYHEGHRGFERGGWRQKPWLMRAAMEVAQQAQVYRNQRARCGGAIATADGGDHGSSLAGPRG
jgi:hypothetical protein